VVLSVIRALGPGGILSRVVAELTFPDGRGPVARVAFWMSTPMLINSPIAGIGERGVVGPLRTGRDFSSLEIVDIAASEEDDGKRTWK